MQNFAPPDCPTDAELGAFDRGFLADPGVERVAAHLETGCPRCAAVLTGLGREPDALAAGLRAAGRPGAAPVAPPAAVGRYTVTAELGRGAMGVVYRAVDPGTGRAVAVKCLAGTPAADPLAAARFRQEVRALARVEHPHVVRLYDHDLGADPAYLVMEFVDGEPLSKTLGGRPLPPGECAALVAKVARAVHAVHGAGLLHRDLKPGNVLLTRSGEPKVSDFGLARPAGEGAGGLTRTGTALGTPQYMPPEQAGGDGTALTPAADVYALGATLYELLTGRPPFLGPTALSVLEQVAKVEPVEPARLQPGVPRDLETVCLKCLEKDPAGRYQTAEALADDLGRFLAGRPVAARRVGPLGRARRWARRDPVGAGFVALLAVTAAVTSALAWQLSVAKGESEASAGQAASARVRAEGERDLKEAARAAAEAAAYDLTIRAADADWLDGRADKAFGALASPAWCPPHRRGWEWHYLRRRCGAGDTLCGRHDADVLAVAVTPGGARVRSVGADGLLREWDAGTRREVGAALRVSAGAGRAWVFDPAARHFAVEEPDGRSVAVWDVDERRLLRRVAVAAAPAPHGHHPHVAISPGGLLLARADAAGRVTVWDVGAGADSPARPLKDAEPGGPLPLYALSFSPDGRSLAGGTRAGAVVWDVGTGTPRTVPGWLHTRQRELHGVTALAFAGAGGEVLVTGGFVDVRVPERGELLAHDLRSPDRPPRLLAGDLRAYVPAAASPDGSRVAVTAADRSVRVLDVASGRWAVCARTPGEVRAVALGAGGRHLATGELGGTVRLWDGRGEPGCELVGLGGDSRAFAVAAADGGRVVLSAASGGTTDPGEVRVCVWERDEGRAARFLRIGAGGHAPSDLAVSPGGDTLAVGMPDGTVQLWDWRRGVPKAVLRGHAAAVRRVAFAPDGRLVSGGKDGVVRVWESDGSGGREVFRRPGEIDALALSPDGRTVALGGGGEDGGRVALVRVETGVVESLDTGAGWVTALAFSPDGGRLAANTFQPSSLQVWEWRSGTRLAKAEGIHHLVAPLAAFTGDGRRVVTASHDAAVKVWDADRCAELLTLRGHSGAVHRGVMLPSGLLLTSSWDGTVRVWDGQVGR